MPFTLRAGLVLVLAAGSIATADDLTWSNPSGGAASNAANWNPSETPGPDDQLLFDLANSYAITYDIPEVGFHLYRAGTVTLHPAGVSVVTGNLFVSDTPAPATLHINTGTLRINDAVILGRVAGSNGSVHVHSATGGLECTAPGPSFVGLAGSGTLLANSGAHLFFENLTLGRDSGANGTLELTNPATSALIQNNLLIGSSGAGTLRMNHFASLEVGSLTIAPNPGATGTAFVGTFIPALTASFLCRGDLHIGLNTDAGPGGSQASFKLQTDGSLATIEGDIQVGDPQGGYAELLVDGGELHARGLHFNSPSAVLSFANGTIEVGDGGFTAPVPLGAPDFILGQFSNETETPRLFLRGTSTTIGRYSQVGSSSNACSPEFHLVEGAQVTIDNDLAIAPFPGSNALCSVAQASRLDIKGALSVSDAGLGGLRITTDSQALCDALSIEGPDGHVRVLDASLVVRGPVSMGLSGPASLAGALGSSIEVAPGAPAPVAIGPEGAVTLDHATMTLSDVSSFSVEGTITLDEGSITSDATLVLDGSLAGNGAYRGDLVNAGAIAPSGGTLSFDDGEFVSDGPVISGDGLHFGSNSRASAGGTWNCAVASEALSRIDLVGDLAVGELRGFGQVDLRGDVSLNDFALVMRGVTPMILAGITDLGESGRLEGNVHNQGLIIGSGHIGGGTFATEGTVSPGHSIGSITADSWSTFENAPAGLIIEVESPTSSDEVHVVDHADIFTTHLVVSFINGFEPGTKPFRKVFLTASSYSAAFASQDLPSRCSLDFFGDEIALVYCPADLSGASDPGDAAYGVSDGRIDSSDFFFYLDQFAAANLAIADMTTSADPNDPAYGTPDGVVDASDFFFYLDLFAAGCD